MDINTVSRQDLFDQVWSKPMRTLAVEYGVSATHLKSICVSLDIPVPIQGHWNKVAAGKPADPKPALPETDDLPGKVTIMASGDRSWRGRRALVARYAAKIGKVPLTKPLHPLIAPLASDKEARWEHRGMIANGTLAEAVERSEQSSTGRRRLMLASSLFWKLEAYGFVLELAERREFIARHKDGRIYFKLQEMLKLELVKRDLSKDPLARLLGRSKYQIYHLTGLLCFEIISYDAGAGTRFIRESRPGELDGRLSEVVAMFLVARDVQIDDAEDDKARLKCEAEARERAAQERRRKEEEARLVALERTRLNAFVDAGERWHRINRARSFLDEVRRIAPAKASPIEGRSIVEWCDWAEQHLNGMDPLKDGASAFVVDVLLSVGGE